MITLGQLIDRLIITSLKHHFADTSDKKESTVSQIAKIQVAINQYMASVIKGDIPVGDLKFEQNKIYTQNTSEVGDPNDEMSLGELVNNLADANIQTWVNQEKVYKFREIPDDQKVEVIDRCATLNIERNRFIEAIDEWLTKTITSRD